MDLNAIYVDSLLRFSQYMKKIEHSFGFLLLFAIQNQSIQC
jgi:hypothetical protein